MAIPWDLATRQVGKLTVVPGPDLKKAPAWGDALFKRILSEFNRLSTIHKLGVSLKETNAATAPMGIGGAHVQIEVSTGTHTFTVHNQKITGSLDPPPNLNGKCHSVHQGGEIFNSFVFVPINPTIQGGTSRGIGAGAKIALSLHELIHACGLEESDPGHNTGLNDPDLFMTNAQFEGNFPPDGTPGDRFFLGFKKFVPPFFLSTRTASLVQKNWK